VWGVNAYGQVYIYSFGTDQNGWNEIPGALSRISAGAFDSTWGFNSAGQIYQFASSSYQLCFPDNRCSLWNEISSALHPVTISAGWDGDAWVIDANGTVWHFDAQSGSFVQAGAGMKSIAVASDAIVWALDNSGHIYRYW
jgi:hypothetical protein